VFDENEEPADGAKVLPGLMASFDVIEGDWGTFYLDLRMLMTEGLAEIVSRPVVLVVEGTPAEIHAGREVPYQSIEYESSEQPSPNTVWRPVGVRLKVTPTIEPPDRIKLDIEDVSVSSLLRYENIRGVEMPLFQSREESTVARVKDGSTLVIGGLLADTMRVSETKVPILGDIPLLGFFFRGTSTERLRTDLYIIMRPSIIRPGEPATLRDFEHLDEAMTKTETMVSPPQ
jgi:general secretion pathway protein D